MSDKVVILNSRQGIRPCLSDSWVKNTIEAVEYIKENNFLLLTSAGMSTWDLLTSLGSLHAIPMNILIPKRSKNKSQIIDELTYRFDLDKTKVQFQFIEADAENTGNETYLKKRDAALVDSADILVPISIRKRGYLQTLIDDNKQKCFNRFLTDYHSKTGLLAYSLTESILNPQLKEVSHQYLIHWTKTSNAPWPNERIVDYYKAVSQSAIYPRTAFDTLQNILKTETIFASSKNMPSNTPSVAFSCKHPKDMLPLFRWRARHMNMSFEPYGIGIIKEKAVNAGVCRVHYYDKQNKQYQNDSDKPAWQLQSRGVKTDWSEEDEYRYKGNFDISIFSPQELILFTRFKKEADRLQESTGIRTIYFEQ